MNIKETKHPSKYVPALLDNVERASGIRPAFADELEQLTAELIDLSESHEDDPGGFKMAHHIQLVLVLSLLKGARVALHGFPVSLGRVLDDALCLAAKALIQHKPGQGEDTQPPPELVEATNRLPMATDILSALLSKDGVEPGTMVSAVQAGAACSLVAWCIRTMHSENEIDSETPYHDAGFVDSWMALAGDGKIVEWVDRLFSTWFEDINGIVKTALNAYNANNN